MLSGFFLVVILLAVTGYGYLHLAKFGALPADDRLENIEKSPNYHDGQFRNLELIPMATDRGGILKRLVNSLFAEKDRPRPPAPIPSIKINLAALDRNEDVLIWLGHSSFYTQLAGYRILVAPVFSDNAAPIPFVNKTFTGTNIYSVSDNCGHYFIAVKVRLSPKTPQQIS